MLKRGLVLSVMVISLAGCEMTTPKDERVCLDIVKSVVVDPATLQVNNVRRSEGSASIGDLEQLYRARRDGNMTPATQALLDLYKEKGLEITRTYVRLDVTFDGRSGRVRDEALCGYLSYDGNTELTSFTLNNQDVEQHQFLDFFIMRGHPKGLDSNYRL